MKNKTIEETLKDRGSNYGSFSANVEAIASIMDTLDCLREDKANAKLTSMEHAHLKYIVIKLVRLGATPDHCDSWHDLQGYAKLSEEYFEAKK